MDSKSRPKEEQQIALGFMQVGQREFYFPTYTKPCSNYDRYWDTIISEQSLIEDAERKGRTEGEQIGETRKALEMAKNLKLLGILSNAQIAQVTNLSLQQIETL